MPIFTQFRFSQCEWVNVTSRAPNANSLDYTTVTFTSKQHALKDQYHLKCHIFLSMQKATQLGILKLN